MLCAVKNKFRQTGVAALFLAHPPRTGGSSARGIKPHLRFGSRPALGQVAHSQPAWLYKRRRRQTRCIGDWSSDVCSSDLVDGKALRLRETFELKDRSGTVVATVH